MRCILSNSRSFVAVAMLFALPESACAQQVAPDAGVPPNRSNPVAAAVAEASRRFDVPEPWIRAVMRVESRGNATIVSRAGAIGLMQVMPETYAELRRRLGLGGNPFNIRDNVLAGTAYMREMHDRYGMVGMAGAYNAGPRRWEQHLAGIRPLPGETVDYLRKLGPVLGFGTGGLALATGTANVPSGKGTTIFAAIGNAFAPNSQRLDPVRNLAIVRANPTTLLRVGGLFARNSVEEPLQSLDPAQASSSRASTTPEASKSRHATAQFRAINPLFVPRNQDGGAR